MNNNDKLSIAMLTYQEKGLLQPITKEGKLLLSDNLDIDIGNLEYAIIEGLSPIYIFKISIEDYPKIKLLLNEQIKMFVNNSYLILSKKTEEIETMVGLIKQCDILE